MSNDLENIKQFTESGLKLVADIQNKINEVKSKLNEDELIFFEKELKKVDEDVVKAINELKKVKI